MSNGTTGTAKWTRATVLGAIGVGIITYALVAFTGCNRGPSAEDRGFLKGCDVTAHDILLSLGIPAGSQEAFDKACKTLLDESKAKK